MIDLLLTLLLQDAPGAAPAPVVQEQSATETQEPATAPPPGPTDPDVVIEGPGRDVVRCHRVIGTGSIVGRRVCTSRREEQDRMARDQRELEEIQRQQTGVHVPARDGQ